MKRDTYSFPDQPGSHLYPLSHWQELSRFVTGSERDPRDLFNLSDDRWETWPYAVNGQPSQRNQLNIRFRCLQSFLKPYVKWYCYQRLIGRGKMTITLASLPYSFLRVDKYLSENSITSLDELASPPIFTTFWQAQMSLPEDLPDAQRSTLIGYQRIMRKFWEYLSLQFGAPQRVPPIASFARKSPTAAAADESDVIPTAVILQLTNKLGLHRTGEALLNRFNHLRLCVLVLLLCTGCRLDEILRAPRCSGPEGPLSYYPIKGSTSAKALWFQFTPNKQGSHDHVYISPEWVEITRYCVQALLHYSDEVRDKAHPTEQGLLILISYWNYTSGVVASKLQAHQIQENFAQLDDKRGKFYKWHHLWHEATGLTYNEFRGWLSGHRRSQLGILKNWNITVDGKPDGAIYRLRSHQARHTRQTALARDPQVSSLARQYDINHNQPDAQFAYQHALGEQNEMLQQKARDGQLLGPALPWILELLDTSYKTAEPQSQFQTGQPSQIPLRWRHLIATNPQFLQFNRVPCGYCTLPQGPQGCEEYMNCCEAEDGGCQWFVTDPENEQMLIQITRRARSHRKQVEESTAAGRTVQAGKYEVLASRTETMEGAVLQRASQELRERLLARKREIDEELE